MLSSHGGDDGIPSFVSVAQSVAKNQAHAYAMMNVLACLTKARPQLL